MAFSMRIPRDVKGSNYPVWEEIALTEAEERAVEAAARERNIALLKECLRDAGQIVLDQDLKHFQNDLVHLASELFNKRSSHEVFWKEAKCREKFKELWKS